MSASRESAALELFHPIVRRWFEDSLGTPTDVQRQAWPRIAAGEHLLITAPTGSGKTLTAFLWALDRLLTGAWEAGRVRLLYVSPLRALNTDIRRNLRQPLAELDAAFQQAGHELPKIRALTRSGDTSASERRKMLRRPPEILITTPESLNILLTSQGGRGLLAGLETVILDEIHAVAGSKRGTHLITAVDRLVALAGDFQRLALSATARPLDTLAAFVGGFEMRPTAGAVSFRPRPVGIVESATAKTYDISVRFPEEATEDLDGDPLWKVLCRDFRRVVDSRRSTLVFTNNRRLTEKVTHLMNKEGDGPVAYSHHGSLSREVRQVVERKLKDGELAAIVATSSLELGIDVGALDTVLLVQTPPSIAAAIQRSGRAGHQVGEVSRSILYPTYGRDFLDAAVVARAMTERQIEPTEPPEAPLDVLAQVVLSMVAAEPWSVEDLYHRLRSSYPYRDLSRQQLDLVLDMLTGRFADSRIRELQPRLRYDRAAGRLRARRGVERLIYLSGGTIPDRGYFALRLLETMAKIGELDEEFVWERSVGDSFTLGAQSWRIQRITHNDVLVTPGRSGAMVPFWRADALDRGAFLAQRVGVFLQRAEGELEDEAFLARLLSDHRMEERAAEELRKYLRLQKSATGRLPHRHLLLGERFGGPFIRAGRRQLALHTVWGGTVNRPLAIALEAAFRERHGESLEAVSDNYSVLVTVPEGVSLRDLLDLLPPGQLEELLRSRLASTGFFGSRFRAAASTALLLPRAGFRRRLPLWVHRQRSKKLLESVRGYGDFPMLVETWRTCLRDDMDLPALEQRLEEVRSGQIELLEVATDSPSPFAAGLMWLQTNRFMYEDDTPEGEGGAGVSRDLFEELVFTSHLRPRLPATLVVQLCRKLQRTAEGYGPSSVDEVEHWLEERLLIPEPEWRQLLEAVERDAGLPAQEVVDALEGRALRIRLDGASETCIASLPGWARWVRALGEEAAGAAEVRSLSGEGQAAGVELPADLPSPMDEGPSLADRFAEWLRFYGPISEAQIRRVFGWDEARLSRILGDLADSRQIVIDELTETAEAPEICDTENLEILLRWLRLAGQPSFEALPAEALPLFLAQHQGLAGRRGEGIPGLERCLETLLGLPAPAAAWEADILPARLRPYYPAWLDSVLQESGLQWLGCGRERLAFHFPEDLDLLRQASAEGPPDERLRSLFPDPGRATLEELAARSALGLGDLQSTLWDLAWEGEVANDTFLAVRKGIENRFQPQAQTSPRRSRGRLPGARWRRQRPSFGTWLRLPAAVEPPDLLAAEELVRDRVRLLLERYGVLFREILSRELPVLTWSRVFRTLRLMELAGEVLSGCFFQGVRGLQFASHAAFRALSEGLPEDAIYWLSASDPASLAGVDIEGLKGTLPARRKGCYLVYHGRALTLTVLRRGKELHFAVGPDHPHLRDYLEVLKHLLTREAQPLSRIRVETINGEAAIESPFAGALDQEFRIVRDDVLTLWKSY